MRRSLLLVLAALAGAVPLGAQTELAPVADLVGPTVPTAMSAAAPAESRPRLGYSSAVNVVMALPDSPLRVEDLAGFGGGWDLGHRWVNMHSDEPVGLPGVPIGAPAEARVDLGEPMVAEPVRTPSQPGVWLLESGTGTAATVITQVPASRTRGGRLNGYNIGHYPTAGTGRADSYAPPPAYIEVTLENRHLEVSQHLTLAQFITKDQVNVWPKYLVLDPRLLDKLELVVQELNAMGVRAERVHIMSGYRTPQYNGPGGDGRAALSRHMWGDAADMWIDNDGDGLIDDLNGDGTIGTDDAAVILKAVDRVERRYPELIGGAGVYSANLSHGPFIHIDARGHHSRW